MTMFINERSLRNKKLVTDIVAVHRGVMMADTLSFNAKIGVVDF